jgi:DNA topoisomerase-3
MLVKREAEITAFKKEPFYTPMIDCGSFTASGEKLKDRQAAEAVRAACDGKVASIRSVERQKKTTAPPNLYDLTTLQRETNRLYGFTAQHTLDYAQSLYEKKLITYPRVDNRYLTADMCGTAGVLVEWMQTEMKADFSPDISRIINDDKVTDHHAIIPTIELINADITAVPAGERDLLNLITVRLLCAVAPVHSFETVTAVLDCGGHSFTAKEKTVIEDGWKAIESSFKTSLNRKSDTEENEDEAPLPELSDGQVFAHVCAFIKEGTTTPPKRFTEDTLLSAMENAGSEDMPDDAERKGFGTPATRAAIIEKLVKTGFIERQKKNIIPTDKGKNLIAVLPDVLTSPKLTAEWENKLKQVERGELSGDEFMNSITAFIIEIVRKNNAHKPEYTALFNAGKPENESLGSCPRCGTAIRESAKGFFCDTHSCGFKLWRESKFWISKKKPLTAAIVTALLKNGRIAVKGLHSEKTGKKYDATIILDDTGDGYVNFKMEFADGRAKR